MAEKTCKIKACKAKNPTGLESTLAYLWTFEIRYIEGLTTK